MQDKLPITIFIIAHNEADRIEATLRPAVELAKEVLVIDSGSIDGTRTICSEMGAKVIHNPWSGYGLQKRFGEDNASNIWLLNLDADEVLSDGLVAELRKMFSNGSPLAKAWEIPIAEVFPGESSPHRFAYYLAPVRLYTLAAGRYSDSPVHDRVVLKKGAVVGRTKNRIHHYSIKSIGHEITKLNTYTDRQVDNMVKLDKKISSWRLWTEFSFAFLKAYILRRYFLRGRYGFIIAMNYAIFRHLRVAKHMERRMNKVAGNQAPQ